MSLRCPRGAPSSSRAPRREGAPPLLTGNLILRTPTDGWAIYELEGQSYPGLPDRQKIEVRERIEALAYVLETDFQILRLSRTFDAGAYERTALSTLDPRHGRREAFARHLAEHKTVLGEILSLSRRRSRVESRRTLYRAIGFMGGIAPCPGLFRGRFLR